MVDSLIQSPPDGLSPDTLASRHTIREFLIGIVSEPPRIPGISLAKPSCAFGTADPDHTFLVSAVVSTHNAEHFMRGCLEDLTAQSIAEQVEIIVVDSGSEQNERYIVDEFRKRYKNIHYIRTQEKETVYAAWNRGIKIAKGRYITNANTDDRHRMDAFERMVEALEARPEIALVYGNAMITEVENETFDRCTPVGQFQWLDWDRSRLLEGKCFIGPQPMWRKRLHDEYGYFDESFTTSGDLEFWMRVSQTHDFLHLNMALGLYLRSPNSLEHRSEDLQSEENRRIVEMYQQAYATGKVIRRRVEEDREAYTKYLIRKGEEIYRTGDLKKAKVIFERVITEDALLADPLNNLGVIAFHQDEIDQAVSYFRRVIFIERENRDALENLARCMETKRDYEEAISWYLRALEVTPDDVVLLNSLGNCLIQKEDLWGAKVIYQRSLELDSTQDAVRAMLIEIDRVTQSPRKAGI